MNEVLEVFPWNESFATGIAPIDEQHQRLVCLINSLANSIATNADEPSLNVIFNELADYASYHFKAEEGIWQQFLAEDVLEKSHRSVHESFITDVRKLMVEGYSSLRKEIIQEVLFFLVNWLAFHILDSDKRMAKIVQSLQSGISLDQAKLEISKESGGAMKALISTTLAMYNQLSKRTFQLISEVNDRKLIEERLLQLSFYDQLTNLPNRRLLNDRLSQAMATSKRSGKYGALMFLDLDNFKPLNDTHGHAVGDLLLIQVAVRLRASVRESDTVARFGGDEFVIILDGLEENKSISTQQAFIVADKIRKSLSETYFLTFKEEGKPDVQVDHHCTTSIGIVLFANHESRLDDMLKWADVAMYRAKDAGRNSIRFYTDD